MTHANWTLRKARLEDAGALAQAERDIARIPGRLASHPDELKDESFREKIQLLADGNEGLYLVAEEDGLLVGHAFFERHKLASTRHVANLTIAVHEGHQGKGVGRGLMEQLLAWAKAHPEVEKCELHVRSSNQRAIKLYESLGFVEQGRKPKHLKYAPGVYQDDIYMALWVGP